MDDFGRTSKVRPILHNGKRRTNILSKIDSQLAEEIKKRRTFAIISHPDAGKTTLTEKFLLYGGAINLAGTVKGRKAAKHAVSD